uniref:Uncharacterized protein n=1 Tax=Rhizophora mucronata TaxID=61149 RepID=A0A2P2JW72_RHIMU
MRKKKQWKSLTCKTYQNLDSTCETCVFFGLEKRFKATTSIDCCSISPREPNKKFRVCLFFFIKEK